ncbi:hypothetical protein FQN50_001244 [Emmonsiellopsis sp. PD_5]|nr:hypothetical protein FQN50_001244 [Emmonsiellopsis sp. PD_5]
MASTTNAVPLNGSPKEPYLRVSRPSRPLFPQPPPLSLALYPLTLLLGSLYSLISPTAKPASSTASPVSQGQQDPVNYFAWKGNIFNVYFVKIGWAWTTLAFISLLITQPAFTSSLLPPNARLKRVGQAVFRYVFVTVAWLLTTQWFFGPGIIDRSFVATGGRCEASTRLPLSGKNPISDLKLILTATACKASGGSWMGGHDVSGHVFMLVLASSFLILELQGASCPGEELDESKDKYQEVAGGTSRGEKISRNFVLGVAGLSWWMLFMTAIFFHTWLEKMTGLIIALGAVYTLYFLPRTVPSWRAIVGIPGR